MTKRKKNKRTTPPGVHNIKNHELNVILDKTKNVLSEEEMGKLRGTVETLAFLTSELEKKNASIAHLRFLIFGPKTESSDQILGKDKDKSKDNSGKNSGKNKDKPKPKPKGHGRNGADDYTAAKNVSITHKRLGIGHICPGCNKGKLYELSVPSVLIRIESMPPLSATRYDCQRLRCSGCGKVFTAEAPGDVGIKKYDESAVAMVGLFKYGTGMPFFRLEKLQASMGTPMPSTTQWDLVADASLSLQPVHAELVRQAAQGHLLHNDDTTAKILSHMDPEYLAEQPGKKNRTGTFTTGIISMVDQHKIALFFTGAKHAGENLADVLALRAKELGPPIQMCDLLNANTAGDFKTIVAGCNAHARRRYVRVADNFPAECEFAITCYRDVYRNDAITKKKNLTPEQRLAHHQHHSAQAMDELLAWGQDQLEEKKVESNSSLGEAIVFLEKHWDRLTLFLRVPGAPVDNNCVERLLKRAILHRKNAMFFKTDHGAKVADLFMSLINTAELAGANVFDYLVTLLRNADKLAKNPNQWLPWNYLETVAADKSGPAPPG